MRAMRSYMIKPLALLASRFDEVLLIDHDTYVFRQDLELLFQSGVYRRAGMLLFRDRVSAMVKGQPLKQPSRYVRQVVHHAPRAHAISARPRRDLGATSARSRRDLGATSAT